MKPRKQSSPAQQGLRNSRASLSRILSGIRSIQQVSGRRQTRPESRQLRRDGRASRGQGLKILAREAKNIAAQFVPKSRTEWSWDCRTPDVALAGIFVSGGALVFLRVPQAAPSSSAYLSPWGGSPARRTSALAACMSERAGADIGAL